MRKVKRLSKVGGMQLILKRYMSMKELAIKVRFTICILVCFFNIACGARWMVKGQVVDAQTSLPISGAAVFIEWSESRGLPGLGYSSIVETAEDLTSAGGLFQVPKYSTLSKDYRMAVYKKGYVCWSSRKVFPTLEERTDFKLKGGMVIKLERFKEEYSKIKHASFTSTSSIGCPRPGIFSKAIKSEEALLRENR